MKKINILIILFLLINNLYSARCVIEKKRYNGGQDGYNIVTESDWVKNGQGAAATYTKQMNCLDPGQLACVYTGTFPALAFNVNVNLSVLNLTLSNYITSIESNPIYVNTVFSDSKLYSITLLDGSTHTFLFTSTCDGSNTIKYTVDDLL